MDSSNMKRRSFVKTAAAGTAAVHLSGVNLVAWTKEVADKPALLGGKPVRTNGFPDWPVIQPSDDAAWLKVMHDKNWCSLNGNVASNFESAFAERNQSPHCVAIANGTNALYASLHAAGVGPGDEVLLPPYTFVATLNAVLLHYALPVFVDSDFGSHQMDPAKIEERITGRTKAIIPVHIGGNPADMDGISAVAKKHNLPVIEDACQAHFAEWRGKQVGSWGDAGCFSFQVTKILPSGEGGAVLANSEKMADGVRAFYNNGRSPHSKYGSGYIQNGSNLRMTEFQAQLLLLGLDRIEDQLKRREQNAEYLSQLMKEIPGVEPATLYDGVTRCAYYLYMFKVDPEKLNGLSRNRFVEALRKEGISCSTGYSPLNKLDFLKKELSSRFYKKLFPESVLSNYSDSNECPENDRLCEAGAWLYHEQLLGTKEDIEQIAFAMRKIANHSEALAKA